MRTFDEIIQNRKNGNTEVSSKKIEENNSERSFDRIIAERKKSELINNVNYFVKNRARMVDDYNSRYYDSDGNFITTYRSDTKDWVTKTKSDKYSLSKQENEIRNMISKYGDYYDEEFVSNIVSVLDSDTDTTSKIVEISQKDHDYFSQWEDEAAYTRDMNNYQYSQKYANSTYADLQKAKTTAEGAELEWLEAHDTDRQYIDTMSTEELKELQAQRNQEKKDVNSNLIIAGSNAAAMNGEYAWAGRLAAELMDYFVDDYVNPYTQSDLALAQAVSDKNEFDKNEVNVLYYDENGVARTLDDLIVMRETEEKYTIPTDIDVETLQSDAEIVNETRLWLATQSNNYENIDYTNANPKAKQNIEYLKQKYNINTDSAWDAFESVQELEYYLNWKVDSANYANTMEENAAFAQEHPGLATAKSIVTAPLTVFEFADNVLGSLNHGGEGAYALSNVYDDKYTMQNQAYQSTVAEMIDTDVYNAVYAETGNQWLSETTAWLASGAYSGATSAAQSALTTAGCTVLFGPAGPGIALGIMGAEAAASSYHNAILNGSTNGEAILTATAAGLAEALFEKVSLDGLLDIGKMYDVSSMSALLKSMVKNSGATFMQGATEASEEFLTEITNKLADEIINGNHSAYNTAVSKYTKMGYSYEDACEIASKDVINDILTSLYGGFIGGVGSGSAASMTQGAIATPTAIMNQNLDRAYNTMQGQNIVDNGQLSQLVTDTQNLGKVKGSKSLQSLANKVSGANIEATDTKGQAKYVEQVGKLYKGVQQAQLSKIAKATKTETEVNSFRELVKAELKAAGVQNVDKAADVIVESALNNGKLTREESSLFNSVRGRTIIDKVLRSDELQLDKDSEFEKVREEYKTTKEIARYDSTRTLRTEKIRDLTGYDTTDGATRVEASGEEVEIKSIEAFTDDDARVKLDNGDTISVAELTVNNDVAVIINGLKMLHDEGMIDVPTANYIMELASGTDMDAEAFMLAAADAISLGSINYGEILDTDINTRTLPENIRQELFKKGQEYSKQKTESKSATLEKERGENISKALEKSKKEKKEIDEYKVRKAGNVTFKNVKFKDLNKEQKAQVRLLEVVFAEIGLNVEFFASPIVNGKRVGESGSYDPNTNTVRIDVFAGNSGEGLMLFTASHELTHFIREWSPAKFKVFADFLIERYAANDISVKELINKKIEQSQKMAEKYPGRKVLTYDGAYEEVVADACESFLRDSNVKETLVALAEQDATLVEKIIRWIQDFTKLIKDALDAIKGKAPESKESAYVLEDLQNDLEKLHELWDEAVIDARENLQWVESSNVENTTNDSGMKEQARNNTRNVEKDGKKRYNKQSYTNSKNSILMQWANSASAEVGELKIISDRYGKFSLYEKTADGCIEIMKNAIYEEVQKEYERIHEEENSSFYEDSQEIRSVERRDMWNLFESKNRRYANRDVGQIGSEELQSDITRSNEHLWTGDKRESVKYQDRDSSNRKLTEEQAAYFADSKIRDENGNLLVMYHGSPKTDINSFRLSLGGAYFTTSPEYAREYARDVGKVYEVYLNITKPFDTRIAECREIFEKEFYRKWGNGAPLSDRGLPDWTDGDDLIDFLQEKGYDYDGLLLDEGGVPTDNGVRDRGISYVVFDKSNQVKYTDNLKPTVNENMKFALRENVEETKDLVAVHNLSEEKLLKSLKLGGLPMPSIAIARAKEGHSNFGTISLVFSKDTISPTDRRNKVYSGDAWTPTYPQVEYKTSYSVADKVQDKIDELLSGTDYKTAFGYIGLDYDNINDYLNRNRGDLYEAYGRKNAFKLAYLKDKGIELELPKVETQLTYRFDNEVIIEFAEKYGKEKISEMINYDNTSQIDQLIPEIKDMVEKYYLKTLGKDRDWDITRRDVWDFLDAASEYFRKGITKKTDTSSATQKMIDEAVDENDYKNWMNELFSGIIEKEGIRNNKDLFTSSGNRRSFEALHYEHNLENVVKAMKEQGTKGIGAFGGGNIFGAVTTEYGSISEIKDAANNRMKNLPESEYDEIRNGFRDRFFELANSLPIDKKSFSATDNAADMLIEAVVKFKTKSGMANYLRTESKGWANYSDYVVDDLIALVNDIRNMPVGYFEAKPQRIVEFNEVATAIIPDNSSTELKTMLDDNRVKYVEYEYGNEQSRVDALNAIEDVKFQDRNYAPTFYSQMGRVIESVKQEKLGAASVIPMLKGKGIKNEEIKWSGIEAFLEGKKSVTKQELQEFIAGSMLQIEETELHIGETKWHDGYLKLPNGENYREFVFKIPNSTYTNYAMRGHWGDNAEGIIAHARVQDFIVNGNKMLFVEEIQSDWHNDGYKNGYESDITTDERVKFNKQKKVIDTLIKQLEAINKEKNMLDIDYFRNEKMSFEEYADKANILIENREKIERSIKRKEKNISKIENAIPDAPFRNTYHEYVLKRLLRMAAEEDYDSIGWTPADVQSKRWSDEYAEGYRIEYDQDIPKFLNKYGKKWGAKVGTSNLSDGTEVWSMDITDSMKDSVLYEGQVLYQDRAYTPSLEELGLKTENEKLKKDVTRLNELLKLQKTLTHGTIFTAHSVNKEASKLMKTFGMHKGKEEFAKKLHEFYSFIARSEDLSWQELSSRAENIAKWVDEQIPERNVREDYADTILKDIRSSNISLDDVQKAEVAYKYGSYNAYRKSNFGSIKLTNDGIKLDSIWQSWAADYPNIFDANANSVDMPILLADIIEDLKTAYVVTEQYEESEKMNWMVEELYDSYWNVSTYQTLADKHQKQITDLKIKHKEDMAALREQRDAAVLKTKEQYKEHYQDMIQRIRADKDAKLKDYKERVQEQRKKNVEGRNKTALKNKIKNVVKQLDSLYNNGTKERNVKIDLRDTVEKALILADVLFDNGQVSNYQILTGDITTRLSEEEKKLVNEWRLAHKQREDFLARIEAMEAKFGKDMDIKAHQALLNSISYANKKMSSIEKKLSGMFERQRGELEDNSVKNAINALTTAYKSMEESKISYVQAAYSEYVYKRLDALRSEVQNTKVKNMTLMQLQEVYDAYKMVLTSIRTSNEVFLKNKRMSVEDMGTRVIDEVKKIGKTKEERNKIEHMVSDFSWKELKPIFAFERIGSKTFLELYNEARKGEDTFARDVDDAKQYINDRRTKYGYDSWDMDKTYEFKLADGRIFSITLQELMSIYAYSKREQALDHISDGGFVFNNNKFFLDKREKGLKGKIEKVRTTEKAYRLGVDELVKVVNSLTDNQKKYVDEMQDYLSAVMGAKGNEVSRVLYGIDLFKEKYYFPLVSSKDFIFAANNPAGEIALRNSGMTKATVPHARNPIVLDNFEDVWSSHVNKMSLYHSFVLPIENLNKVHNYTGYARNDESYSVSSVLSGVFGNPVNDYISGFIKDLNGGVVSQGATSPFSKMFTNFKKTAVAASTSVVVQQPTAVLRAMAMINPKYFKLKSDMFKPGEAWEEIKKYAPVAILKEIGGFDVGGGKQIADYIMENSHYKGIDKAKAFFTDSAYRDKTLMSPAGKADEIGWNIIWSAVQQEIKDTTTLKVGSEEFYNACGERFTEVITYTQVYDSVFSRSAYMRSKNDITKMATAFMGEPTTSFNMMYNAVLQAKRGSISKGKAIGVVGATISSIVLAAVAKSFIYALRDDDEDESYAEKYLASLADSLASDLFIPNMIPFVKDITSMLQGWDVERTDMAIFKDIKDAVDGLDSSTKSTYRKVEDILGAVAALFGIPLGNVMRTGREIYNAIANIFDDNYLEPGDVGDAVFGETTVSDVNEALEKGNTEKAKNLVNKIIEDKMKSGKTEKEAKAAVKSSVTSYWKPLYIQAYKDNNSAEMLRIRKILQSLGIYDSVPDTCSDWIKSIKNEKAETETKFKKW